MTAIQASALPGLDLIQAAPNAGYQLAKPRAPRRQPNPYAHLESNHWRGVRAGWCPTCRQPILTGPDEDFCAAIVRADTTPLSAIGEALTLLGDRATYLLDGQPAHLTRRNSGLIKLRPAGNPPRFWHKYDILPAHQCGQPTAETLTAKSMLEYLPPKRNDANAPAPF